MHPTVAIGIDIGGTNTVFGVTDRRGNILVQNKISTSKHSDPKLFCDELASALKPQIAEFGIENIKGIGVGAPNGNVYTGNIEFAPNLKWKGIVPLAKLLQERLSLPVVLSNDANAAALGEMLYGAARGMKEFIVITLGTGLGSGIVINGKVVYGHDGFAGEIGHTIVYYDGRLCGCGRKGCLETYASASGIVKTMHELLGSKPSILRETDTAKEIFEAAQKGDLLALEAFEFTGKILGMKLADAVAFSSPEAIILFGGLAQAGEFIFEPTKRYMEENLLNIYKNKVKILPSELKESDAAILGASALAWES